MTPQEQARDHLERLRTAKETQDTPRRPPR